MKARQSTMGLKPAANGQISTEDGRIKLLTSLLSQRTRQLEIISKEASEQRKQLVRKNQIIAEYEIMHEQLKDAKEHDAKLLKDELVYRNNVIKSQLETIEKLRIKMRKMDSLLPMNQYEAIEEEEQGQGHKYRARGKGISAEPATEQYRGSLAKNIEVFFIQKRQRFVLPLFCCIEMRG